MKDKAFFIQSLLKNVDFFKHNQNDAEKPSMVKINLKEKLKALANKPSTNNLFFTKVSQNRDFSIPLLPEGRILTFEVFSNWGHLKYCGLSSIVLYDEIGEVLPTVAKYVSVHPRDLAYHHLDNITRPSIQDQSNKNFLCKIDPPTLEKSFKIQLDLKCVTKLSAIKIFNFHSNSVFNIGIRHLIISLDEKTVFFGEVSCCKATEDIVPSSSLPIPQA
jgi:hypothetical protein